MLSIGIVTFFIFLKTASSSDIDEDNLRSKTQLFGQLHDDMILTIEQYLMMKERGFFVSGKWPLRDGMVTVPFYFNDSIPAGDTRRTRFLQAAEVYSKKTCIEWVETNHTDSRQKVQVYSGSGCFGNVGKATKGDNLLSLNPRCNKLSTMIHEMGHAMGLVHTQCRQDRDQYVKIWMNNIKSGEEVNFKVFNDAQLFGIPYDYLSMMHYKYNYFSSNGSFTMTPSNPFALFAMGHDTDDFRWTDAALLNKGYLCDVIFTRKCGPLKCENRGYVGKDCKCMCPENTSGDLCETETGPLFSVTPTCGGVITTEQDIQPNGYGVASTSERCVFHIKAPACHKPQITFSKVNFQWTDCGKNLLALQISQDYFGYLYCNAAKVPIGQTFTADSSEAVVYYYTSKVGSPGLGFTASVKFLHTQSSCTPPIVTTTTPRTTVTTTSAAPVGPCLRQDLGHNTYIYKTPNYPSKAAANATCSVNFKTSEPIKFSSVNISMRFNQTDFIDMHNKFVGLRYKNHRKDIMTYGFWPLTFKYTAGQQPGYGFQISLSPATGLPSPCNGEIILVDVGESKTIRNPLFRRKTGLPCAFLVQTGEYNKLEFTASSIRTSVVWIHSKMPKETFVKLVNGTYISSKNMVKLYFVNGKTKENWEIKFLSI